MGRAKEGGHDDKKTDNTDKEKEAKNNNKEKTDKEEKEEEEGISQKTFSVSRDRTVERNL